MLGRGAAVVPLLSLLATIGAVSVAAQTGYIGPFADVFVLGILGWLARQQQGIRVMLAAQPTREELDELKAVVQQMDLRLARNLDQISSRATEVILNVEDRFTVRADATDGALGTLTTRVNQHGEKIAELGSLHGRWPPRKKRSDE